MLKLKDLFICDIGSAESEVAARLSNFEPREFVFDGVQCSSMEGLLQSFKFPDTDMQEKVCTLTGMKAKRRGSKRNKHWKDDQMLYWGDEAFSRLSFKYQDLLDDAFVALAQNEQFQADLLATGRKRLRHSIGKTDPSQTVLTEEEFVSRLTELRRQLRKQKRPRLLGRA